MKLATYHRIAKALWGLLAVSVCIVCLAFASAARACVAPFDPDGNAVPIVCGPEHLCTSSVPDGNWFLCCAGGNVCKSCCQFMCRVYRNGCVETVFVLSNNSHKCVETNGVGNCVAL